MYCNLVVLRVIITNFIIVRYVCCLASGSEFGGVVTIMATYPIKFTYHDGFGPKPERGRLDELHGSVYGGLHEVRRG